MPPNRVSCKLASGDMTESTDGSSYVSFHSFDAEGNVVRWFEAILTSKIEKNGEETPEEERELRRIYRCYTANHCRPGPEGHPLYANQAMLDYTGLTMQDVLASDFRARTYHPKISRGCARSAKQAWLAACV